MGNLTRELRVVTDALDLNPIPDRELVVFKRVGDGRKLCGTAPPGQPFQRPLLSSPSRFVAFAVLRDPALRHSFTRKATTSGQTHFFILHITLEYRVSDPVLVVNKLETDPMRRIEDLAASLLLGTARRLDWSLLHGEAEELPTLLLHGETLDAKGGTDSNFERIVSFAEAIGIEIVNVAVERSLTQDGVRVEATLQKLEEDKTIERTRHAMTIDTDRMAQDRALLITEGKNAVRKLDRLREALDGLANSGVEAFQRAAGKVDSFAGIQEAMRELQSIQGTFVALTNGSAAATSPLLGSGSQPKRVLQIGEAKNPLAQLLLEVFTTLENLPCEPQESRQILSAILHLLAELELGEEEAKEEVIELYASALHARFKKLTPVLNQAQILLLQRLQDKKSLLWALE